MAMWYVWPVTTDEVVPANRLQSLTTVEPSRFRVLLSVSLAIVTGCVASASSTSWTRMST